MFQCDWVHTENCGKFEAKFEEVLKGAMRSFLLAVLETCRNHIIKRFLDCFKLLVSKICDTVKKHVAASSIEAEADELFVDMTFKMDKVEELKQF